MEESDVDLLDFFWGLEVAEGFYVFDNVYEFFLGFEIAEVVDYFSKIRDVCEVEAVL